MLLRIVWLLSTVAITPHFLAELSLPIRFACACRREQDFVCLCCFLVRPQEEFKRLTNFLVELDTTPFISPILPKSVISCALSAIEDSVFLLFCGSPKKEFKRLTNFQVELGTTPSF